MTFDKLDKSHYDDQKIDNLDLDLIIRSLNDPNRIIRQIAFQQLSDLDNDREKQALWNYHPYDRMQCLHTLIDFYSTISSHLCSHETLELPQYFGIADYPNKLVCYWSLTYKRAHLCHWNLATGKLQESYERSTHEFGLGQRGKITIDTYQDGFSIRNTEDMTYYEKSCISDVLSPNYLAFDVCYTNHPLLAIGGCDSRGGEFKVINYENNTRDLHYEFKNCSLMYHHSYSRPVIDRVVAVRPLVFTPDGKILFAHFWTNKRLSTLQVWDVETGNIIKTLEGISSILVTKLAVRPDGKILACGMRDEKVCVWELLTDRILHTTDEIYASTLSPDGRIFAYGTSSCDLVLWDLMNDRELGRLVGHTAPIGGITISLDREFIATYSTDHSIKIWGIPELGI